MDQFVARANIDQYLEMLKNSDIPSQKRSMITRLLIEEVNKLGHDHEQLEFVQSRAAACRDRADRQRRLLDSLCPGSTDWVQAERLLVNIESLAQFTEGFCQQMRKQMDEHRL